MVSQQHLPTGPGGGAADKGGGAPDGAKPAVLAQYDLKAAKASRKAPQTAPPKIVLTDAWGVPQPNCDQRHTDVHGREMQPDSDPDMPYLPVPAPDADEVGRQRAQTQLAKVQRLPFTQHQVDPIRYRVTINLARSAIRNNWPQRQPMRHLHFPEAGDLDVYQLREGNAPAASDRPRHMRRVNLAIDIDPIPAMWRAALRPGGWLEGMVRESIEASGLAGVVAHAALLQETIRRLYHSHPWPGIGA